MWLRQPRLAAVDLALEAGLTATAGQQQPPRSRIARLRQNMHHRLMHVPQRLKHSLFGTVRPRLAAWAVAMVCAITMGGLGACASSTPAQMRQTALAAPATVKAADSAADQAASITVACGTVQCDGRSQYCETIKTDTPALPSDYACKPLPEACLPGSAAAEGPVGKACDCFPPGARGNFCSAIDTQGGRIFHRMTVGGR